MSDQKKIQMQTSIVGDDISFGFGQELVIGDDISEELAHAFMEGDDPRAVAIGWDPAAEKAARGRRKATAPKAPETTAVKPTEVAKAPKTPEKTVVDKS